MRSAGSINGYVKLSYANIDAISGGYGTEYFKLTFKVKENISASTDILFSASGLTDVNLNEMVTGNLKTTIKIEEVSPLKLLKVPDLVAI